MEDLESKLGFVISPELEQGASMTTGLRVELGPTAACHAGAESEEISFLLLPQIHFFHSKEVIDHCTMTNPAVVGAGK